MLKPNVAAPLNDAMAVINVCGPFSPPHHRRIPAAPPATSAANTMNIAQASRAERSAVTACLLRRPSEIHTSRW